MPKVVIVDAAGIRHVFPEGFDPVEAGNIVRQQTTPKTTGFLDTTGEILKNAATSFIPGALKGAVGTVAALPVAAYKTITSIPDAVSSVVSNPKAAFTKAALAPLRFNQMLADWPRNIVNDLYKGAVDPTAYGKMIGESLGEGTGAAAAGQYLPVAPKPVMRVAGKALQYAGENPFAARMAGGAGVVGGIYRGDPAMVAAGVAGLAAPKAMSAAGRGLRVAGGESPAVVELGAKGVADLTSEFDNALAAKNIRLNERDAVRAERATAASNKDLQDVRDLAEKQNAKMVVDRTKAQAAAEAEAAKVRAAEAAREGLVPQSPTYRESVSGTTPEGLKVSATQKYVAPEPSITDLVDEAVANGDLRQGTRPPKSTAPIGVKANTLDGSPLAQAALGEAAAVAPTPVVRVAPSAPAGAPDAALEAELLKNKLAAAERSLKVEGVRSSRQAPGSRYSPNDLEELSTILRDNPGIDLESASTLLSNARAARATGYRINAGMDTAGPAGYNPFWKVDK